MGGNDVTPYLICVLPRSAKPLVIAEDVHRMKDEPPQWKERARFD